MSLREYYQIAINNKPLGKEEQQRLFEEFARTGDPLLRERLIKHNMSFVIHLARKINFFKVDIPLEDVISHGLIGLIYAVDTYDPARGVAFSTFAFFSIRKHMLVAFYEKNLVKLPKNLAMKLNRLKKEYDGRPLPTLKQVEDLCTSETRAEAENLLRLYSEERQVFIDHDVLMESKYKYEKADLGKNLEAKERQDLVESLKDAVRHNVSDRDLGILMAWFGIGQEPQAQKDLAEKYGISRQAISYIISRVISFMRLVAENRGLDPEDCL
jgi:RNA polymerase sigma-B factor